jgi:hypothetical protein
MCGVFVTCAVLHNRVGEEIDTPTAPSIRRKKCLVLAKRIGVIATRRLRDRWKDCRQPIQIDDLFSGREAHWASLMADSDHDERREGKGGGREDDREERGRVTEGIGISGYEGRRAERR